MNLGQMILRVKRQLPSSVNFDDATITLELNHGVDEANLIAQCYKKTWSCSSIAEKGEYSISSLCPGYLSIWKSGVWWFDENGKSKYLYPKTKRWLDTFIRNWRDASSALNPTWYAIENDTLIFYPKPSAINTFTIDGITEATPMDNADNYPWTNGKTEFSALRAFDNAIISYAVWMLAPAVLDKEGRNAYEEQFLKQMKKASAQVKRRWDMTSSYEYPDRQNIPGSGFLPR
jgi:hypothetical protein